MAAGENWTSEECDAIVADYFAMLREEQAGRPYNKAAHRKALMQQVDRSNGSIEMKHCNITAALEELGMTGIWGYKPRPNFQAALVDAIERYLDRTKGEDLTRLPELIGSQLRVVEPPPPARPNAPLPAELNRLVGRFDAVERDMRNRALGLAGELRVMDFERARLINCGRADLAERVRHVSVMDGDGAGFDIASFEQTGAERLIEVKTTKGKAKTAFFMSRNERRFAEEAKDRYQLYRVHEFGPKPALFVLRPPLDQAVRFSTELWRAELS